MENKEIVIFTSPTCAYCEMAKEYFRKNNIEYVEKSTSLPENRKQLVAMGIRGVPAIFMGDKHIVGFDAAEVEKMLKEFRKTEEVKVNEVKSENIDKKEGEVKMEKFVCTVCGYVYDPEIGDEDNGVKPGTAFADLPEDWVCPACGVGKDMFEAE